MATPNYSYEKRQRELAKKRKAEEKRQRKIHRTDGPGTEDAAAQPAPGEPNPPSTGSIPKP